LEKDSGKKKRFKLVGKRTVCRVHFQWDKLRHV